MAILLVGWLFGIREAWRRHRDRPWPLLFMLASFGFFVALALRLAPQAWETGNRSSEFFFVGLAFVVAGAGLQRLRWPSPRLAPLVLTAAFGVVLVGGVISGWPWDAQLAKPLRVSAEGKTISSPPLALAEWARREGPSGKWAAATADGNLLLVPGGRDVSTGSNPNVEDLLTAPELRPWQLRLLRENDLRYVVADNREVSADGLRGYFFQLAGDPASTRHCRPARLPSTRAPRERRGSMTTARSRSSTWRANGERPAGPALGGSGGGDPRRARPGDPDRVAEPAAARPARLLPQWLRDCRRRLRRLPPPPTRLATISVALSLAVLALLPLPLNYLGGLTPATWALALVLVVLVGCGIAAYRRRGTEPAALALPRPPALSPLSLACGLGALVAVVAALVLAFVPLSNNDAVGFTELSIHPVAAPGGAAVRVGVGSEEQKATVYRLQVRFGGGGAPVVRRIQLAPGESSVLQVLASPQPRAGRPTRVAAALYRAGEPKRPYRLVYGWIPAIIGR